MNKNILSLLSGKKAVGLYIGQDTVDLVVLRGTIRGPRLINFGQTYIYPKEGDKGEVVSQGDAGPSSAKKTKEDYIVEAIKRVFKENNVKPGRVAAAMSSEEAMVRYFQMPKIPKKEWSAAVNFEAKRYIPFRIEDVASDFQVMPSRDTPNSMDVVFVAVKKMALEKFVSIFERAGVRPVIIEPAPFSLMRALSAAEQIDPKVNTAVVNIAKNSANINILRNGVPYIIRDMPLYENISEGKFSEPVFEKLLGEIKLSFDFYEKQFPSEAIDKIIIQSQLPLENWHEIVGKELQIPVEVGDPMRGIRIKKGIVPPRLTIAFGLALRGTSGPFININLYKEKLLAHKQEEIFVKMIFLEASVAVFLLILLKVLSIKAIGPLTNELNKTLAERSKVEVRIKKQGIKELERLKNEMESNKMIIENVISHRTYLTSMLSDLVAMTPSNLWLTEISFEEKVDERDVSRIRRKINIKGYCVAGHKITETDTINNFLMDLKEGKFLSSGMSKVDIVSVKKTEVGGEKAASFEMLFTGP
ncbi:MAG: pilus assembly protein PilM [Candidatus Omnitrophica bacterium]|nr:pilus assembly protein PilM [Candidatus Omnitrophota bacterium]MBU4457744.1 pilus assembly protein PilM [Candidatus Omnitrophota bacterium]